MKFIKMHGTGNDFVMIDGRALPERDWAALALHMCDRHFGVGADGLILVLPSQVADLRMRMWNPDGSEAEMCGNGIRCFTKLALEQGMARMSGDQVRAETGAGILGLRPVWQDGAVVAVQVNMGPPVFEPALVPVALPPSMQAQPDARGVSWVRDYPLEVGDRAFSVACLSMGNPHAVHFFGDPLDTFPLQALGPLVERHLFFPNRVNFHLARVQDRTHIQMRSWERGAGLTLACGTGACAVAVAAFQLGLTEPEVEVRLPGGALTVRWPGSGDVLMTGPAQTVFAGEWPEPE
ncbi:MAG TPA: diaminopimelate epimerase [Dehalococcoidia bacterium]|nr:diaminopimelate epimerase [Dehalococcoidia bacterium]